MVNDIQKGNNGLVADVKLILDEARKHAYRAINATVVQAYWLVGRRIVQEEQNGNERADYGRYIIKTLSQELSAEFGNGFSVANLKNFRQFYPTYPDIEKGYTLCR